MCECVWEGGGYFSQRRWYSRELLSDIKLLQKAECEMIEMSFGIGNTYGVARVLGTKQNFNIRRHYFCSFIT